MKTINEIDFSGKTVLVRCDFNVPLKDGKVSDSTRLAAHIPTIKHIIARGAKKIILISHLGRPKGTPKPELSLNAIVGELSRLLGRKILFLPDCVGEKIKQSVNDAPDGTIILLENLRFHPEEEKNDAGFAKQLASFADIFVQDAFAVVHRAHASTVAVTEFLPSYAGFLIEKEVAFLSKLLSSPQRPFAAVIGGAKISTKISVIENLLKKVDKLLIGGAMSYTFLLAKEETVGLSKVEKDFVGAARKLIEQSEKIVLPEDHLISRSFKEEIDCANSDKIPDGFYGVDIGEKTAEKYGEILNQAKTIFWNGPMGIFEVKEFSRGTREIAKAIASATASGAVSVAGGGDSVAAIKQTGLENKFSHISTGGGASLEFIEGKTLPGIAALK